MKRKLKKKSIRKTKRNYMKRYYKKGGVMTQISSFGGINHGGYEWECSDCGTKFLQYEYESPYIQNDPRPICICNQEVEDNNNNNNNPNL